MQIQLWSWSCNLCRYCYTQNRIVIFGDSITSRIRVKDFNRELNTGHAKIKTFPGAISKEFPHYVTPTLKDGNFDTAILHFGVNDSYKIEINHNKWIS